MSFAVVLLAAGASSRMGRPKLLLPWGGTSVLGHLLAQWRALDAAHIAVVCATRAEALRAELDRLGVSPADHIPNPRPELGMFHSIQCAARWDGWHAPLTHWILSLGDQPQVRAETLRRLLDFAAAHPGKICQPGRNGRARHPVVLPAAAFAGLRSATAATLKEFLLATPGDRALCEMDDAGLDLYLDHPSDYDRARRLAFGETSG